jgi:hypothetical protein
MCFKLYGRALRALTNHTHSKQKADEKKADKSPVKQKPDGSLPEESSKPKADESEAENSSVNEESSKPKADESEAENSLVNEESSKPKADESEADNDNSDENRLHENPCRVLAPPILPVDSGPPVSLLS